MGGEVLRIFTGGGGVSVTWEKLRKIGVGGRVNIPGPGPQNKNIGGLKAPKFNTSGARLA